MPVYRLGPGWSVSVLVKVVELYSAITEKEHSELLGTLRLRVRELCTVAKEYTYRGRTAGRKAQYWKKSSAVYPAQLNGL